MKAEYKLNPKRVSFGKQGGTISPSTFTPQKDNISATNYTPLASTAEPGIHFLPA